MITVSALPKDPQAVTPLEAADLLAQLAEAIAYHNERYHGQDAPEISDKDFDQLMRANLALEEAFPHLVKLAQAPSQKVGAAPNASFGKITHEVAMLSLANAFDESDVTDFLDRIKRFLSLSATDEVALTAEPKKLMACHLPCVMKKDVLLALQQEVTAQQAKMSQRIFWSHKRFPNS